MERAERGRDRNSLPAPCGRTQRRAFVIVTAAVIGAGPAGLMAAEVMAKAGLQVTVYEAKPSPARKFLMAGKSGLNLTYDGDFNKVLSGFSDRAEVLEPALRAFDNHALRDWAEGLGVETFVGSTGRVFPKVMKASPLLRAWMRRLEGLGVELKTRWRWAGWDGAALVFVVQGEPQKVSADVTVLACGGASWARLGSDGAWAKWLEVAPFKPSNVGLRVDWTAHMAKHFGQPIKGIAWTADGHTSRGEAVISQPGLEGGGIYPISRYVRDGSALSLDLLPDMNEAQIAEKLSRSRGKVSFSNHLRKSLKLSPVKTALLQEWARPLPQEPAELAGLVKALKVPTSGCMEMDGAISTAGGVPFEALDDGYMLTARPGTFCAGEMLDWDAPTGGWLLTGCFATGAWAGQHAVEWVSQRAPARP